MRRRVQRGALDHRGRKHDPLYGIRRVLHRHTDQLSDRAWQRLHDGLTIGEVSCAWSLAQDLMACDMACYRCHDRARAERLIAAARDCPVSEITRLGRTLHVDIMHTYYRSPWVDLPCVATEIIDQGLHS